ncbi:reverse transcriptase family protein [Rickettsia parkeri str. Tate's Hell]|uniref:Reverse transcriptase family protein n=1 Tax=Rickettsia parkeri str. Tate's Hell TaxID=1359189 RepID=A0ABR5DQY6_RICPA|nr:reverse transcriptase N-terminal domain-containing protein [Rickettsia parkeri]AFC74901.1 reverse transcriptase [Rickettsia parkeri str. Portsmouth]KJV94643.1 reverse transcriptase family protein [Rickettsia parkeri str. Grand Bay]KJV96725.1 reverse transcriptase family protein [Rickettsia parkeri str. AT\
MQNANVTIKTDNNNFEKIYWYAINWQEVNKKVNNLRRRIYRASANGNMKLVRSLQKLMLKSRSNKLLAIRRITQINRGRRSPGIDKIVVNTDKERNLLMEKLANNNLSSVKPIKRVYIPKRKGKLRPLGLPIILDRCMQAVVKSALEPFWEAKFEGSSYGFRPWTQHPRCNTENFCYCLPWHNQGMDTGR